MNLELRICPDQTHPKYKHDIYQLTQEFAVTFFQFAKKLRQKIIPVLIFLILNSTFYILPSFLILNSEFFPQAYAATNTISLSEVYPNPNQGESEWVELYNSASLSAELTGWKIEDQLTTPSTIFTFTTATISAQQYLVVNLPTSKLNNSGDGVTLKDTSGQIIDSMSYANSTQGKSWAKDWITGSWLLSNPTPEDPLPQPTPSPSPTSSAGPSPTPSPAPTPTPTTQYSTLLQPSEIMACATDSDSEWLEIYNPNSSAYSLEDWKIQDSSANTKIVNLTIGAQSYGVISWVGSLLNNSGDSVSLINPNGQSLFTISFGSCQSGQSFILYQDLWQATTSITKGAANIYTSKPAELAPTPVSDNSDTTTANSNSNDFISTNDFSTLSNQQPAELAQLLTAQNSSPNTNHSLPNTNHLPDLVLGTSTKVPYATSSASTDQTSRLPSPTPLLSVILGGLIITSYSLYQVYVQLKQIPFPLAVM